MRSIGRSDGEPEGGPKEASGDAGSDTSHGSCANRDPCVLEFVVRDPARYFDASEWHDLEPFERAYLACAAAGTQIAARAMLSKRMNKILTVLALYLALDGKPDFAADGDKFGKRHIA
jgi:hypothetical protein